MKQEEIDSMINAMSKEIDEKDKLIERLSKAIIFLGTNENLAVKEVIEMFSDDKRTETFDDFMERWEKMQWKESHLKDKVIDMMAEDIWKGEDWTICDIIKKSEDCYADTLSDGKICGKECIKDYYFKKARGEEK